MQLSRKNKLLGCILISLYCFFFLAPYSPVRLTKCISEIYSLPSMDRFIRPCLKRFSSARAMSERASSRAEARSVSRVSSSIAMGIDKGRALVMNPVVPVDVIAKVVIKPRLFSGLFLLHLTKL